MKHLNNYVEELKTIFSKRLKSVFIWGSAVTREDKDIDRNVDLIVIVDELSAADIKKCARTSANWAKRSKSVPVIMSVQEWLCSSDVYAIEYAEIKAKNRIIYGENLIDSIDVKKCDLRLQCEREAKNILMRYRKYYLLHSHCNVDLRKSFVPAYKDCMAVFKTILRLKDTEVSDFQNEIIEKIAALEIIDKNLFERMLCFKENKCKIENPGDAALAFIDSMDKTLKYINYM